jgi:integral membrane protein
MLTPIRNRFLWIARIEGISFIVLLFIAMPLKYFFDVPKAVTYFGWVHGLLFIAYVALLAIVAFEEKWGLLKSVLAFVVALLPFGPFWFDRKFL